VKDGVVRIFPALMDQAVGRLPVIFDEPVAVRIAVRDRESGSVSRRFGATLGGVFGATLGGVEHRVPAWC